MNKKVFLVVMAGLLCSKGVFGAEQTKSFTGDEMIVSATKTLNSISDTGGSSVTVITSEEIKNSGKQSVEEVIKGTAGIDVAANGGPGTLASVFLRGADSKNTLVLIDGVPANDPSDANRAPNFANLTVDNIDRIEIVRGSVSFLYGSNASAGVINILTKKGTSTPESFAGIEGGSYGTYKVYGGTNGQQGILTYSLGASRLKTEGFSSVDEHNKRINPTGKSFEKDGYENTTLSGNFGLRLNEHISLETVLRYTKANVAYDYSGFDISGLNQDSEQLSSRIALKMNYKPLVSTLYYNVIDQDRTYLDSGAVSSTFNGHRYEIGWQGDVTAAENNTVSVGLNYQQESMRNESFGDYASLFDKGIGSNSVFLQDQWHIGSLNLIGGLRYEDNEKFGSKGTYRFAPSYTINDTVLKFSYGTGFRAPSLYELYSPYGNAQLRAETSSGWDAGFEQKVSDRLKLGATYFRMDFDNRIDFDLSTYTYAQVAGITKTYGVESFVEWKPVDPLLFAFNYTYTSTADPLGSELLRRPKNKVGLTGTRKLSSKVKVSTNMQWVGTRTDSGVDGMRRGQLPSYFLLNLTGSYHLADKVDLYGRIDNVFNNYYEEAWGYATPARSAYAGIKVTF
ncbi:MAG: TonB-dependent receptor [Chlorobiales bacterium]|nr:TonB-dependent receptor [Chlorobiales bacterium]